MAYSTNDVKENFSLFQGKSKSVFLLPSYMKLNFRWIKYRNEKDKIWVNFKNNLGVGKAVTTKIQTESLKEKY